MISLVVGSVPRGEDYFGQEYLIDSIWERLQSDNILLVAPRRFGKTAAMYNLLDQPKEGFQPVYSNVEHIMSPSDFMIELLAKLYQEHRFRIAIHGLWKKTKSFGSFLRDLPEDIDIGGLKVKIRQSTDVRDKWQAHGERIMSLLSLQKTRLLLILDEFAVMIDHIAKKDRKEAEHLLRWFRSVRQSPDMGTRFIIGGSIHLIPTLDAIHLVDTVNDLFHLRIKPFTDQTAQDYIKAIFQAQNQPLTDQVSDTILELVGTPIPYLLAVFLSAIFDKKRATKSDITTSLVRIVFDEDLLGGATAATFHHYRSRIDMYYSKNEARAAKSVLGALSRTDAGIQNDALYQIFLKAFGRNHDHESRELFMGLMTKLENDFYISLKNDRYDFYSRVLKLWWKTRYGFQGE